MDVPALRYFLAVVDHGTVTRAAANLHVSQPALSQAIRRLEHELGTALFRRTGRTLALTTAGHAIAAPARQALRQLDAVRLAAQEVDQVERGHVRMAVLPRVAATRVATMIGEFRRAHAGVSVAITSVESARELEGLVAGGGADLGVTELPLSTAGLEHVELATEQFVALLPAQLARRLSAEGDRITVADLADMPLITHPPGTSLRELVDDSFRAAGLTPVVACETTIPDITTLLVIAGAGAAIVPEVSAAVARVARISVRHFDPPLARRVALVHAGAYLEPAAQALLALAELSRARP